MAGTGILLAASALIITSGRGATDLARAYGAAYASGNYAEAYKLISERSQKTVTLDRFAELSQQARQTATVQRITIGEPRAAGDNQVQLPVRVDTRLFGTLRGSFVLPTSDADGRETVDWSSALIFPGLRNGERLRRETTLPPRADLVASDGTPLVTGSRRTPSGDPALASIVGQTGPIPTELKATYDAAGVPSNATVGISGLERVLDAQLRGRPGGTLFAGSRVIATAAPEQASAVVTTIQPTIQRAAVAALGARLGGIAVIRPTSGAVVALAGGAFSSLQPPGSTFKIITAAAGLRYKAAQTTTQYPVETETVLSGVTVQNADGEACGGTFINAFAHSCNTVFAPLGAKVGSKRLVETAEAFGFNRDLGVPGAATSTIPSATELGNDPLVVGSTAIGQGKVQASALQMALVSATIAQRGERPKLTFLKGDYPPRTRVLPQAVASGVVDAMAAVVNTGTGKLAKIAGVKIAGKTGTAELKSTQSKACDTATAEQLATTPEGCTNKDDLTDTTAWFAGFAPADDPRVAIAVQLPAQGRGGDTAAPIFRVVADAALKVQ